MSRRVRAVDVIAGKRDGREIPGEELRDFVLAYAREELPDYQMAAFLMAGYLRGFTRSETEALTEAMVASGERLDLGRLSGPTVDKHSTGGWGANREGSRPREGVPGAVHSPGVVGSRNVGGKGA